MWACELEGSAWTWDGEEGILPTSLKLGRRSKLVLVPPRARCNASRSAGEGAKARKNSDPLVEGAEDNIDEPIPVGLRLSKEGKEWCVDAERPPDILNSLASGLRPFFALSFGSLGSHLRVQVFSKLALPSIDSASKCNVPSA